MPLPASLARFNKRATNRLARIIAGWMPGFAIVIHSGRKSGREYRTPVNAFRTATGYRVALTYGAGSDWVRNVLAAGGCDLLVRGRRVHATDPGLGADPTRRWAPPVVRQVLGWIDAAQYLDLTLPAGGR